MRLPGTRYQEHGWEQVRKMLGRCFLHAFAQADPALLLDAAREQEQLALYIDLVAEALHAGGRAARAEAPGNSYGDSVAELSLSLLYELQARPGDWSAFRAALAGEHARLGAFWNAPGGEAILRKKINDLFAVLRDKVDADNYMVACGRSCSANRMYTYRMLDTAYSEIARVFAAWSEHRAQAGAILGRDVTASPIEARLMTSISQCRAEWVIGWSESLGTFGHGPGPLHTRSKRFASLKNSPDKIDAMLREIGDYEELSANRDHDWLFDEHAAAGWTEDLWNVLEAPENDAADRIAPVATGEEGAAARVSLPLRLMGLAGLLDGESLPVRLAVYLKTLGPDDESYPGEWLDAATGELPTMAQLAALDRLSLPTLRKRRDAAIARLLAAAQ